MADLCAVVLAAGEGQRLRPLTELLPKALCPVGNVPLLDLALARVAGFDLRGPADVAVNASYLGEQVVAHAGDRAHLSVEPDGPLGTSGGVGNLRDWIGGRGVLVANADAYLAGGDPGALLAGWDGETVRLLGQPVRDTSQPGLFSGHRFAGLSLLPWRRVRDLDATPAELVRTVWRPAEAAGELEVVPFDGVFIDTGTPHDYLAANLHAAGHNLVAGTVTGRCVRSVVGAGATVAGDVVDSVVWPGAVVAAGEHLDHAIRAGRHLTVAGR
ncbi:sugar phosphate nucleotidyltransferase [Asanoa sp. NPDC050611]|uniref:nucleotidyltransferase family protein n=1 Tax=Asanoa sp. NPDC050611 TaxID=3157098 RepID=UPI0034039CAF